MAPEAKGNRKLRLIMPMDHHGTNFRLLKTPKFRDFLGENLNVVDVVGCLSEKQLLTKNEFDEVLNQKSHSAQVKLLLDYVNNKSKPELIPLFVNCLETCGYFHTAKIITDYLDNLYRKGFSESAVGLKCGLVPPQPVIFVQRDLVYKLKDEITKVCGANTNTRVPDSTNWILVHGMPGNGKTYLTAAAVRSPEIWSACFPSGIYWLDIGKPGTDKLMIKLGALLQMLEDRTPIGTPVAPKDVDAVIPRLAQIFAAQKSESAIVLDDVWDEAVIKCFSKVPCKCIIVTSRRADIISAVTGRVLKLDVSSGFTADESKQFFAQILEKRKEDLPPEAQEIHDQCTGSPMLLSLIGGLLRDYPSRWQHYLNKLKDHSQFEHQNIDEAIKMSVDALKDDLKEKFFDFAVFDDDVPIPVGVFGTLWNIEILEDVEDMMAYFVNSSLVTKEYCEQRNCILYRFHDLILHYARCHVPTGPSGPDVDMKKARETALVDKHRKLFFKYRNLCKGKFENLEDDFYFCAFVGYHMSQGKLFYDIQEVYRNQEFLERRLECSGPEVVLVDVILLKKQHPFLNDLMVSIEDTIRKRFDLMISSPDVNLGRRPSSMYASKGDLRSHRNSWIDVTSNPTTAENERLRSSSDGHKTIHEVQSEPAIHDTSKSAERPNGQRDVSHPDQFSPSTLVTPVSMLSLRNDVFEDY